MARGPEDKFPDDVPGDYRSARRAFVAACEAAGADVIARVHPGRGPDGGPLFMDTAAFGPRDAAKALLIVSGMTGADALSGSAVLARLLAGGLAARLPDGARLMLLHAFDPWSAAWAKPNTQTAWSLAALGAAAGDDLPRCGALRVLNLAADGAGNDALAGALTARLAGARVTVQTVPMAAEGADGNAAFAEIAAGVAAALGAL